MSHDNSAILPFAVSVSPPARQQVDNPELEFWQVMMDLALQRVSFVLDFARNWSTIRLDPAYELQRARCQFHLDWIFDDESTQIFTFRELCRFSKAVDLQDVDPARRQIRSAFSPEAFREIKKSVPTKLRKHVTNAWLNGETASFNDSPLPDEQLAIAS
jgi:hypothetical protein